MENYDFAFSFAGENRDYVEAVKNECEKLGLKIFYDKDKNNEWWGRNFIAEQRTVYSGKTKYFVPFISEEYFNKNIPSDEFESALMPSITRGDDPYILPVIIGNPDIPVSKLHPTIHYLKAAKYTPKELAKEMLQKIKGATPVPKQFDALLEEAMELPMPKIVPHTYNSRRESDELMVYIGKQFNEHLPKLESEGFGTYIKVSGDTIEITVDKDGKNVFTLNIFAGGFGDEGIGYNFYRSSMMANSKSYNGNIGPFYNKENGNPMYKLEDFSGNNTDNLMSKKQIVEFFWKEMNKKLEA